MVASVVKVSSNQYCLTLNATTTGTPIQLSDDQGGDLLNSLNIASSTATTTSLSAQLTYNNLPVIRPTNQINDLIPGATINLLSNAPTNPLSIALNVDVETIKDPNGKPLRLYDPAFMNTISCVKTK